MADDDEGKGSVESRTRSAAFVILVVDTPRLDLTTGSSGCTACMRCAPAVHRSFSLVCSSAVLKPVSRATLVRFEWAW